MATKVHRIDINGISVPFESLPQHMQELVLNRCLWEARVQSLQQDITAAKAVIAVLTDNLATEFSRQGSDRPVD